MSNREVEKSDDRLKLASEVKLTMHGREFQISIMPFLAGGQTPDLPANTARGFIYFCTVSYRVHAVL